MIGFRNTDISSRHPAASDRFYESGAIVQDGEVVFAVAEERLNRVKHYAGFPALAVKACLDAIGAKITARAYRTFFGAALHTYHAALQQPRCYQMKNSFLGPEFSDSRIEAELKKANLRYRKLERGAVTRGGGGAGCQRERRGLVSGANGMGPAGAG